MGDRVEERDIRGETFLNRSDSPMRGLIVFPFISPTRFRIFGVKREARSVRGGEKCAGKTLEGSRRTETATNRRNSSADGSRIFLSFESRGHVRPNDSARD